MQYSRAKPKPIKAVMAVSLPQSLYNRVLQAYEKRKSSEEDLTLRHYIAWLVMKGVEIYEKENCENTK